MKVKEMVRDTPDMLRINHSSYWKRDRRRVGGGVILASRGYGGRGDKQEDRDQICGILGILKWSQQSRKLPQQRKEASRAAHGPGLWEAKGPPKKRGGASEIRHRMYITKGNSTRQEKNTPG